MTNAPNGKGERTRARLIEAAVERFGAGGFRSTSVAAIAREAGVSPAASFSYWASKEALFEAALDHDAGAVIVELLQMISGPGASSGELISVDLDRWLRLIDDLLAVLESHPLCRRVLAGQEPDFVDGLLRLPVFDGLREVIVTAIEAEQRSGVTRPDLDPRRAAVGIETITLALAMTMLRLQDPPGDDRRAGVAEILLAAFRPPS